MSVLYEAKAIKEYFDKVGVDCFWSTPVPQIKENVKENENGKVIKGNEKHARYV